MCVSVCVLTSSLAWVLRFMSELVVSMSLNSFSDASVRYLRGNDHDEDDADMMMIC